ncbi:MAG: hypothetical protein ACLQJ0_18165 [Steroidobacteraceae bacterium]
MCLNPKRPGGAEGVDPGFAPPDGFITGSVHLAMTAAAQRYRELVTYFSTERGMLCEAQMMGICWPASANQTRLFGHELDVVLVAKAARLGMGQIDAVGTGCRLFRLPLP